MELNVSLIFRGDILNLDEKVRYIKKARDEDKLIIELSIMVEYGTKISVIANNIIQKVRYSVENYTGLKVASVTVNVQAVRV